jgi:hypothetical protein
MTPTLAPPGVEDAARVPRPYLSSVGHSEQPPLQWSDGSSLKLLVALFGNRFGELNNTIISRSSNFMPGLLFFIVIVKQFEKAFAH